MQIYLALVCTSYAFIMRNKIYLDNRLRPRNVREQIHSYIPLTARIVTNKSEVMLNIQTVLQKFGGDRFVGR